jgi:hypothetical protein
MNHNQDHSGWFTFVMTFGFWIAGHVTLSNIAFIVSICVGLLQIYKTVRDLRKDKP